MIARRELLYDTEAALRLVDGEVREMTGASAAAEAPELTASPGAGARAHAELGAALAGLRDVRVGLDPAAVMKLADVEGRLVQLAHLLGPLTEGARHADERQLLADEVFFVRRLPHEA